MKTCPNCGTQIPDDAVFCGNCGSSVAGDNNANSAAPQNASENAAPAATPAAAPAPAPAPAPAQAPFQQQGFQQAPYGQAPYGQPAYQPYPQYDPTDHTSEFDAQDIAENKLFASAPYFFGILGMILAMLVKDSPFVKFHVKNAIRLEIAEILCIVVMIIPFLGWIVGGIALVVLAVIEIICLVNVLKGKAKEVPIVGGIGFLK